MKTALASLCRTRGHLKQVISSWIVFGLKILQATLNRGDNWAPGLLDSPEQDCGEWCSAPDLSGMFWENDFGGQSVCEINTSH